MSGDRLARLTALPPVEIGGLIVDIGSLFRQSESVVLPSDGPLNLAVACAFGAALSQHQETLGLSRDQVLIVSCAFAEVCDALLGVSTCETEGI